MKHFILTILLSIFFFVGNAQVTLTQAQIDSLPASARQAVELAIQKQQVEDNLRNASEYASWGREIGYAVDGALSAVEDHVVSLSETGLGKTVIFLVVWKFMAEDALGMIVGFCFFLVLVSILIYVSRTVNSEQFKKMPDDTQTTFIVCYSFIMAVLFIASMCCAFGG